jgi:hypothetical protein
LLFTSDRAFFLDLVNRDFFSSDRDFAGAGESALKVTFIGLSSDRDFLRDFVVAGEYSSRLNASSSVCDFLRDFVVAGEYSSRLIALSSVRDFLRDFVVTGDFSSRLIDSTSVRDFLRDVVVAGEYSSRLIVSSSNFVEFLRDDVGATVFKLFILTTVVPPPPNGCSNDYKVQKLFRTRQQLILKKKKKLSRSLVCRFSRTFDYMLGPSPHIYQHLESNLRTWVVQIFGPPKFWNLIPETVEFTVTVKFYRFR